MRSTEEKIKRKVISVVIIVAILSTMAGCGKSQSRKEPITLTIWHVYGGQTGPYCDGQQVPPASVRCIFL